MSGSFIGSAMMFLGLLMLVVSYFSPALIALLRRHHQSAAIAALNVLLGWTVLGWIGALIWSLTAVRRRD